GPRAHRGRGDERIAESHRSVGVELTITDVDVRDNAEIGQLAVDLYVSSDVGEERQALLQKPNAIGGRSRDDDDAADFVAVDDGRDVRRDRAYRAVEEPFGGELLTFLRRQARPAAELAIHVGAARDAARRHLDAGHVDRARVGADVGARDELRELGVDR